MNIEELAARLEALITERCEARSRRIEELEARLDALITECPACGRQHWDYHNNRDVPLCDECAADKNKEGDQ